MKNKNRRISVIQEIIATTKVGSQDELLQISNSINMFYNKKIDVSVSKKDLSSYVGKDNNAYFVYLNQ